MGDIEVQMVKVQTYEGTIESAAKVIEGFNLKNHQYFLDVRTGQLYLHAIGLRLNKGDCYHLPIKPEKFEAVG
jgi:hypothetical protein